MPRDWKATKSTGTWKTKEGKRSDSEETESDPELAAEREYALQNGLPLDINHEEENPEEKKKPAAARITQAKAERKARCRGVSGSMTKKQRSITNDELDVLYDDDYDFVEVDDLDDNSSDILGEEVDNHLHELRLEDVATTGARRKKRVSEAASETDSKYHFSAVQTDKDDVFDDEAKVKKISKGVTDLKV